MFHIIKWPLLLLSIICLLGNNACSPETDPPIRGIGLCIGILGVEDEMLNIDSIPRNGVVIIDLKVNNELNQDMTIITNVVFNRKINNGAEYCGRVYDVNNNLKIRQIRELTSLEVSIDGMDTVDLSVVNYNDIENTAYLEGTIGVPVTHPGIFLNN